MWWSTRLWVSNIFYFMSSWCVITVTVIRMLNHYDIWSKLLFCIIIKIVNLFIPFYYCIQYFRFLNNLLIISHLSVEIFPWKKISDLQGQDVPWVSHYELVDLLFLRNCENRLAIEPDILSRVQVPIPMTFSACLPHLSPSMFWMTQNQKSIMILLTIWKYTIIITIVGFYYIHFCHLKIVDLSWAG